MRSPDTVSCLPLRRADAALLRPVATPTGRTDGPVHRAHGEDLAPPALHGPPARPLKHTDWPALAGDLVVLLDVACLVLLAPLLVRLAGAWPPLSGQHDIGSVDTMLAGLAVALVTPALLHQPEFGQTAIRGQGAVLLRRHLLRALVLIGCGALIGLVSHALNAVTVHAWWIWCAAALASTCATRWVLTRRLHALQRQGALTEVVAVVGAGPVADRLLQQLQRSRPGSVEVLGVFDDAGITSAGTNSDGINSDGITTAGDSASGITTPPGRSPLAGTLDDLIELGRTRHIDWIVLTVPPTAHRRAQALVHRLKALATPIGLCAQDVGLAQPLRQVAYLDDHLPVRVVSLRPRGRRDDLIDAAEELLPRWLLTLALLPGAAARKLAARRAARRATAWGPSQATPTHTSTPTPTPGSTAATPALQLCFDALDLAGFVALADGYGSSGYGYAVTPNAEHVIRLSEDADFRALYAQADFTLLDSRLLAHVLRVTQGLHLPVCTGSDLTEALLGQVITPTDPIVLIGASPAQAALLAQRYGLLRLAHHVPPMGFINDPAAVAECLEFVEAHSPFRFCFLAVGSPQQEVLAQALKVRGVARGLTLCIGASINFLTGVELRAPHWMQRSGLEWSWRLLMAPRRMAHRYLVRGPRVFGVLRRATIQVRRSAALAPLGSFGPLRPVVSLDHALPPRAPLAPYRASLAPVQGLVRPLDGSALPRRLQATLRVELVAPIQPALAEQDQHLVEIVARAA